VRSFHVQVSYRCLVLVRVRERVRTHLMVYCYGYHCVEDTDFCIHWVPVRSCCLCDPMVGVLYHVGSLSRVIKFSCYQ